MSPFDIDDPATHPPVGSPMWHLHHEGLLEWLTEPLINRVAYVRAAKSADEIETRLRWMTPVLGTLPSTVVRARAAYDEARAASDEAWAAYIKARAAYVKARAASVKALAAALPAIEALHAIEHPGCPWDGRSIFGKAP